MRAHARDNEDQRTMDPHEMELAQEVCERFPDPDYYTALGYFKASGLPEPRVHVLAEYVSQPEHTMKGATP